MEREIILASQSPRRRRIMEELGLKFRVVPSNIKEDVGEHFSREILRQVALAKVESAEKQFKTGIIIGADTVVVLNGRVYGKPRDTEDAKKMLAELSGTIQDVWTAVVIKDIGSGRILSREVKSEVRMKKLSPEDIEVLAGKNLDKAGAYAVQEDDRFIENIEGSFTNVVGFPIEAFKEMLEELKNSVQWPVNR